MATKFYTLCRHTGNAQPIGSSGKITVEGKCPKCLEQAKNLSRPRTMMEVTSILISSYRNVRTASSR